MQPPAPGSAHQGRTSRLQASKPFHQQQCLWLSPVFDACCYVDCLIQLQHELALHGLLVHVLQAEHSMHLLCAGDGSEDTGTVSWCLQDGTSGLEFQAQQYMERLTASCVCKQKMICTGVCRHCWFVSSSSGSMAWHPHLYGCWQVPSSTRCSEIRH